MSDDDFVKKSEASRQKAVADFPYPLIKVPRRDAMDVWTRLNAKPGTPIVLGGPNDLEAVAEQLQFQIAEGNSPSKILAAAENYAFPADYLARLRSEAESFDKLLAKDAATRSYVDSLLAQGMMISDEPAHGDRPEEPRKQDELSIANELVVAEQGGHDYIIKPIDEVLIATLPTEDWTEAFAYTGFGGWNSCPLPHEQVAAFRYWTARYDLELIGLSNDQLNLRPRLFPKTRDEALALAREQYEFCPDFDQSVTLEELAAGLMAGNWWVFWWD